MLPDQLTRDLLAEINKVPLIDPHSHIDPHKPTARGLDDIVLECSDLTWNQVFSAIDWLSREGALTLTPKGQGLYTIRLSNQELQEAITTSTSEALARRGANSETTHM